MPFKLKEGFLLGAAAAATQIEGGECGHNSEKAVRLLITVASSLQRIEELHLIHYRTYRQGGIVK